jgi:hypothetical protein
MKTLCTMLVATAALVTLASLAAAGPFQTWDNRIGPGRFKVLTDFDGHAVLDKETGLVWERSPSQTGVDWSEAQVHCNELSVANRLGWRLPTLQELASLADPTQTFPALPAGHPFSQVLTGSYWSGTTLGSDTTFAWVVRFLQGTVGNFGKTSIHAVWCVRGGQGVDPQ